MPAHAGLLRRAKNAKTGIIAFLLAAQQQLSGEDDSPVIRQQPPGPVVDSSVAASKKSFKKNRVETLELKLISDLESLSEEFKALMRTPPDNEKEYKVVEDKFGTMSKRADVLTRDGAALCNDALEGGLEQAASNIDKHVTSVKGAKMDCEIRLGETKIDLNVFGDSASKLVEIKPPVFSGDHNQGLDFFAFKKEYEEFAQTKNHSNALQLQILKKTCLTGPAKALCADMASVTEVMTYLKNHYGCARLLLGAKIADFKSLGACPHSSATKKRTWLITANQKLKATVKLAKTHNLENNLYFSNLLPEIRLALPYKLEEQYKERLEDSTTGCTDYEEMFCEMVRFLDYLVEKSAFEVNYELAFGPRAERESRKKESAAPQKPPPPRRKGYTAQTNSQSTVQSSNGSGGAAAMPAATALPVGKFPPKETLCNICKKTHLFLFQCEKFQSTRVKERSRLSKSTRCCFTCLRMDSNVDFSNREAWWEAHKANCDDKWACSEEDCATGGKYNRKYHFTMCIRHTRLNKEKVDEFIKSLDRNVVKPGTKFFFCHPQIFSSTVLPAPEPPRHMIGSTVLDDIYEPSIFMLQNVLTPEKKLYLFSMILVALEPPSLTAATSYLILRWLPKDL
jgi:hypothetical protein